MSDDQAAEAELLKLARVLEVEPEALAAVGAAGAAAVRALREQIADRLFDADRGHFERIGAIAARIPVAVSAQLAPRALGPLLAARAAGQLDPDRAADLAGRLDCAFLADVAVALDPRHAVDVIAGIPPAKIAEIAGELDRRGEWIAMAAFVGHLHHATLRPTLAELSVEGLLRTGFVIDDADALDAIVDELDDDRATALLRAGLRDELTTEGVALLRRIAPRHQRRFAALAEGLDPAERERLTALAVGAGLSVLVA